MPLFKVDLPSDPGMEKVVQEEVIFDNLSEYSSAFPRFHCLRLTLTLILLLQSWFSFYLSGDNKGKGWRWRICEGGHIILLQYKRNQQVDHDYVVEASKLLHNSGCPDLHLLTSQVHIIWIRNPLPYLFFFLCWPIYKYISCEIFLLLPIL